MRHIIWVCSSWNSSYLWQALPNSLIYDLLNYDTAFSPSPTDDKLNQFIFFFRVKEVGSTIPSHANSAKGDYDTGFKLSSLTFAERHFKKILSHIFIGFTHKSGDIWGCRVTNTRLWSTELRQDTNHDLSLNTLYFI